MTKPHGLQLEFRRSGDQKVLHVDAFGTLTHGDYEALEPVIEETLDDANDNEPVLALIDATEFRGWEPRAAWDDLRLGAKYGSDFDRVAIVADDEWKQWASRLADWFVGAEIKAFEGKQAATSWLLRQAS